MSPVTAGACYTLHIPPTSLACRHCTTAAGTASPMLASTPHLLQQSSLCPPRPFSPLQCQTKRHVRFRRSATAPVAAAGTQSSDLQLFVRVASGDSLEKLALKFNCRPSDFLAVNKNMGGSSVIYDGELLRVPPSYKWTGTEPPGLEGRVVLAVARDKAAAATVATSQGAGLLAGLFGGGSTPGLPLVAVGVGLFIAGAIAVLRKSSSKSAETGTEATVESVAAPPVPVLLSSSSAKAAAIAGSSNGSTSAAVATATSATSSSESAASSPRSELASGPAVIAAVAATAAAAAAEKVAVPSAVAVATDAGPKSIVEAAPPPAAAAQESSTSAPWTIFSNLPSSDSEEEKTAAANHGSSSSSQLLVEVLSEGVPTATAAAAPAAVSMKPDLLADLQQARDRDTIQSLIKAAMPAVVLGVGTLTSLRGGWDGAMETVGLFSLASFVGYDLLWADSRHQLWKDITSIRSPKDVQEFLEKRRIAPKV